MWGLLVVLWAMPLFGADPVPREYLCRRADSPPRIDGRLDDRAWRKAAWTSWFVDIEGGRKLKPRYRTRLKMLWDEKYFYVGAELEEPDVWATLTEHDSVIFRDNDFELFVDPNGDNHEYFEFEINALNTGWDLFLPKPYKDGGSADNGWEIPGLLSAVQVRGTLNDPSDRHRGWSVELAIPWAAFGERARMPLPPREGDQWRVNFSRVEWRHRPTERPAGEREDNWVWSPQGLIDMHQPRHWGYVQFGGGSFRRDATIPARNVLHTVYEAEKEYRKVHGAYTGNAKGLGIREKVQIQLTPAGYLAEWGGLRIREDSLIVGVR